MPISYRGTGTAFSASGGGTTFTLNKPAGAVAGDRIYAMVAFWTNSGQKTISCTGWTVLNTAYRDLGTDELQVTVLTRYVESGDPASWSATASGTVYLRVAGTVAFDGVQSTGNRGTSTTGSGTSFSTATVNATESNSWRLVAGAYFSGSADYNISSNETTRRWIEGIDSGDAIQAAMWDSNGTIATGNTSRTVSRSATWSGAASVIVLLNPETGTPATGALAGTLPSVEADAEGDVVVDGPLAATLPSVAADMDGLGQPPEGEGDVVATLPSVQAALLGGEAAYGPLAASLTLSTEAVGETRFFGVRVINVEYDDRTIEVESRAVAD